MALIPKNEYPTQTIDSDPDYPLGKARNVAAPGDGTGTPLEQKWVNDLWGFLQALLDFAGVTPSGSPDRVGASDYLSAMRSKFELVGPASSTDNGIPRFDGTGGKTLQASGLRASDANELEYITPPTRTVRIPACAGAPLPNYMPLFMSYVTMDTGTSWLAFDLGGHVPSGATITAVKARVKPGSARAGANRMLVDLSTITSDSTVGSEGSVYDDGTTDAQTIPLTGLSVVVDRSTKRHVARIRSGNDANTYNDLAYYLEVTFTDPGPRNH